MHNANPYVPWCVSVTYIVSGYKHTTGNCRGGNIGGVGGILTATACAHVCDNNTECAGFVFANLANVRPKCYPKKSICAKTVPKDGVTMYTKLSKFTM